MELNNKYIHKVQYYETDRMAIVHHSNYIRWFEEARLDYMKNNGVDYASIENKGVFMPVINVNCEYKYSAKFGDWAVIETNLTKYNGIVMEFSYVAYLQDTDVVLVRGNSKHCFIDENTRKPVNMKKRMPEEHEATLRVLENTNNI